MSIIDLRNAIARQEDSAWDPINLGWTTYNPNSLAQKNLNPGNLRYTVAHPEYTPGAIGAGAGGFAKYASVEDGVRDLERQINIDAGRDLGLDQFINKYAPSSENQTSVYLRNVMEWLGLSTPSTKLTSIISGVRIDNTDEAGDVFADVFGDETEKGGVNVGTLILAGLVGLVAWTVFRR